MESPVFLEGERVTLHPVEEADAAFLARVINHPEVRPTLARFEPMTEADEREWIESIADSGDVHFLIRADGERVGIVGLNGLSATAGLAEAGYFLAPEAWGNGYATDALSLTVGYAFEERRLHRVGADVFAFNDASRRVLEKVGFEREGTRREAAFVDGEYVDVYRYGLLEGEWRAETE